VGKGIGFEFYYTISKELSIAGISTAGFFDFVPWLFDCLKIDGAIRARHDYR